MSLSLVRAHFRTQLVSLGFTEWKDGFNTKNLPSTKLEKAFHLLTQTANASSWSQTDTSVSQRVTVEVFRKGYRCASDAIDNVLTDADSVINKMLTPSVRFTGGIKNIRFIQMSVDPIDDSNDNSAVLKLDFDCLILFNGG